MLAVLSAFLLVPRTSIPEGAAPATGTPPVMLEPIPGTALQRITLTARAAERLDIQTRPVSEQNIVSTLIVAGVISPAASGQQPVSGQTAAQEAAGRDVRIKVILSHGEWQKLAKDKPARLLPLAVGVDPGAQAYATLTGLAPAEDPKTSMLTVYYTTPDADSRLQAGERLRVELALQGETRERLVVPYDAIYYGAGGEVWVYVNSEPLVFHREPIMVDYIAGEWAVLSTGPAPGTPVVTVGAALLYGTEVFGK